MHVIAYIQYHCFVVVQTCILMAANAVGLLVVIFTKNLLMNTEQPSKFTVKVS